MIPLYKPYMPELPELDRILHSGQLAHGKYTCGFETDLKEFIGREENYILATNSFNMAIAVVNSLLDINAGDEIIASPMACLASTQPFASHGIKIKWADVDPKTGTLCPESVKKAISPKTKVIYHNHFCGYPGYVEDINGLGMEFGIPVVDDGIEGFGSEYRGNRMGNWSTDITIFSFNAVRIPNTVDGGCVVLHSKDLYEKAKLIRDCGIDRTIFRDELGEISPECDITLAGHSATMSNVNAYIGIQQMKHMGDILIRQREQAENWNTLLESEEEIVSVKRKEINPNYWVYGVLANDKRKTIEGFREHGWYASGVHINNNIYSIFGKERTLPGVEEFYNHFVALPCGWWIT